MSLNLITDAWIPVRRKNASRAIIAPWQMADDTLAFPDWPRADLNIACLELLIGLVFIADPPSDVEDWQDRQAPNPERLRERLARFVPAFNLLGDGPRFMQDLERLENTQSDFQPLGMLFVDSGGENTYKLNSDLFVKRARYGAVEWDTGLAAISLFAAQIYAYSDSSKHKSSLRDNGPVVTLVESGNGLWSTIWGNTPYGVSSEPGAEVFPWQRPTVTSEKSAGRPVTPVDRAATSSQHHPETFFSMPWRLRLVEKAGRPVGFVRKDFGTEYEGWIHPLSPYRRGATSEPYVAVKARPGVLTYRNWLGVIANAGTEENDLARRAENVRNWRERSDRPVNLIVAGWAMSKAKPQDFLFSRAPLITLDAEAASHMARLVEAADKLAAALRGALSFVSAEGEAREAVREDFYVRTQSRFEGRLHDLQSGTIAWDVIALLWIGDMRAVALDLFDAIALPGLPDRDVKDQAKIIEARRALTAAFAGYGKLGREAFVALELPVPEQGKSKGRRSMSDDTETGATIARWWKANLANRENGRARALAARLRRSDGIEALVEPEVHDLAARLNLRSAGADRLVRLVQVLAGVRESGGRLAQRLGGAQPVLSPLRFQRLLRARGEDVTTALRRALPMVDRRCDVAALGKDLLDWDHPEFGDKVRTKWAFDYFAHASSPRDQAAVSNAPETDQ
jgi:CRISPR system Cascade subunit CasA